MKIIISTTMLLVWLVFELKDFFSNGGFSHSLAFGLLKIMFIMASIVIVGLIAIWVNLIPTMIKLFSGRRKQNQLEILDLVSNRKKIDTGEKQKMFRKKSF